MRSVYDSHVMKWKDIRWPQDESRLVQALGSCRGESVVLRVNHPGGQFDLNQPSQDIATQLRQNRVELTQSFDVEIITRSPMHVGVDRGEQQRFIQDQPPAATRTEKQQAVQPAPVSPPVEEDFTDRHDFNTLQWNGERGTGNLSSQPMRCAPMFFRHDGSSADLVNLYQGQTLFLVLNGQSLEGFDWQKLRRPGICTMAVNNGAHGLRPTLWTCVDDPTRFMESIWKDPTITKFVPMAHFEKPIWDKQKDTFSHQKVRDFPNIYGYRRNEAFQSRQWLYEDTINWGNHQKLGGGRSVMLAALRLAFLLGFRRVCLVGCDFYMADNHRYWFPEERSGNAVSNNMNSYRIMTGYFEELQPHFLAANFHVVNCNPESRLKVFPFTDLDTELKAAEVKTDTTTEGMYVDRYKQPGKPQPAQARPNRSSDQMLDHMLSAIDQMEIRTEPFVHIQIKDAFSEDTYRAMLKHLPATRFYSELRHQDAIQPDGKSARLRFNFSAREMNQLPADQREFWANLLRVVRDPKLEKALRGKLRAGMEERFGAHTDLVQVRPVPELIRDLKGYKIGVHTDIFEKVITSQFYLPTDQTQRDLGTTFYTRENNNGRPKAVTRMPFLPRTGYAFAVNSRSWHGVDKLTPDTRPRNSLLLTFYVVHN